MNRLQQLIDSQPSPERLSVFKPAASAQMRTSATRFSGGRGVAWLMAAALNGDQGDYQRDGRIGNTALDWAARRGTGIVKMLRAIGAEPSPPRTARDRPSLRNPSIPIRRAVAVAIPSCNRASGRSPGPEAASRATSTLVSMTVGLARKHRSRTASSILPGRVTGSGRQRTATPLRSGSASDLGSNSLMARHARRP